MDQVVEKLMMFIVFSWWPMIGILVGCLIGLWLLKED